MLEINEVSQMKGTGYEIIISVNTKKTVCRRLMTSFQSLEGMINKEGLVFYKIEWNADVIRELSLQSVPAISILKDGVILDQIYGYFWKPEEIYKIIEEKVK